MVHDPFSRALFHRGSIVGLPETLIHELPTRTSEKLRVYASFSFMVAFVRGCLVLGDFERL